MAMDWRTAAALAVGLGLAGGAGAEVATDGTAGPQRALSGPDYAIGADLGTRAGANLFHSFERFSLAAGERATFSGPAAVDNVVARVTGGARSTIDGTLRSTIAGADLYFINPAGVLFGPNAALDVQGSLHVSTADELRFADGARFSAHDRAASSFSSAAPEAFGFLAAAPAALAVERSALAVPPGETLSLSGGSLAIAGAPDELQLTPDGTLLFGRFLRRPERPDRARRPRPGRQPRAGERRHERGRAAPSASPMRPSSAPTAWAPARSSSQAATSRSTSRYWSPTISARRTTQAGGIALRATGTARLTDSSLQAITGGAGRGGRDRDRGRAPRARRHAARRRDLRPRPGRQDHDRDQRRDAARGPARGAAVRPRRHRAHRRLRPGQRGRRRRAHRGRRGGAADGGRRAARCRHLRQRARGHDRAHPRPPRARRRRAGLGPHRRPGRRRHARDRGERADRDHRRQHCGTRAAMFRYAIAAGCLPTAASCWASAARWAMPARSGSTRRCCCSTTSR